MYNAMDSSFSAEDSRHIINTQGLFRKYLKYDSIPVTYKPKGVDVYLKESLLYRQDKTVMDKMDDVMHQLNFLFGAKSNPRANNNYNALYEMLYVRNLGDFLPPNSNQREYHAALYDHGHKSSASLIYSGMNKYAAVDINSIMHELKNYDRPREMEKMIVDLGNMEFVLNIVGMCEYITAAYDKKIKQYELQGDHEARQSIMALKTQRDDILEHITELVNKYLMDIKRGNQRTFPNIAPGSEVSFTMLTREMGRVNYNFEKHNPNTGGQYDLDHLYECLQPLLMCQDLNRLGPNNPYCSMSTYKQQIIDAKAIYYSNEKNKSTKIGVVPTSTTSTTTPNNDGELLFSNDEGM